MNYKAFLRFCTGSLCCATAVMMFGCDNNPVEIMRSIHSESVAALVSLPGRIQAEDYNGGGQGVGYHDLTAGNSGGQYRTENVDIENCTDVGGGYNVGWIASGEWLNYDVTVPAGQNGEYKLVARVASNVAGTKSLTVTFTGSSAPVSATLSFSRAEGWQAWYDVSTTITLPAGTMVMKVTANASDFNLNYIDLSKAAAAFQIPGRLQAEAYAGGGEGVGYHDLTAGNTGGQYRTDNVDIENCTDVGGGYNVGWIDAGEWLAYDVYATQAGNYSFTARMASQQSGTKTMDMYLNGARVATFTFGDASGWQSWKDVSTGNLYIPVGNHKIRLHMVTGGFNVNYVDFISGGNRPPVANAGPDQSVITSTTVTLDASGSSDPDNGPSPLSYAWTQISGPNVNLSNATTVRPTFMPLITGAYTFRVTVSDGALSATDDVTVTVNVPNLLANGDFSNGLTYWEPVWINGASGSTINDGQAAKMVINAAGVQTWDIQLFQTVAVLRDKKYTLEFYLKSEMNSKNFKVVVEHNGEPWTKYVEQVLQFTQAANTWQKFTVTFTPPANDTSVKIGFHFGTYNNYDVWLDNVKLTYQ